jgi:hypothetical protein
MSARRGYLAPSNEMMAARMVAAAGPTLVDEALGRLATLRNDVALFVHGVPTLSGLEVTAELSSAALAGGWQNGATIELVATGAAGLKATAVGSLAAGKRGVRVPIPDADPAKGPWHVVARTIGPDGPVEASTEVQRPPMVLIGLASARRGTSSPRAPLEPLADLRLNRRERLRVEWPIIDDAATRTARLLDRKGQPLGAPLPFAPAPEARVAAIDLPLASLPEGEFVVELEATRGDLAERRLFAFRVTR